MRISIPEDVAAKILFRHNHTCCVCQIRGKHIQIHHMDDNPSNNDEGNLAVLCLLCHNDTQIKGGFGRKLREAEVRRYRDDWMKRVADVRRLADELIVQQTAGTKSAPQSADWRPTGLLELKTYIESIPDVLKTAYLLAVPEWDKGTTNVISQANHQLISVVERLWLSLLNCYPPNHFGDKPSAQFASDYVAGRYELRSALMQPEGPGTGGTMVRPMVAYGVLLDIQDAIKLTVEMIVSFGEPSDIDLPKWIERFRAATEVERCGRSNSTQM